jgi:AcrR family transcriptional regulator
LARSSKRRDIVEAAIHLLARGGAGALSASALATAAGVSKANVFHHFPRLDDVILEAFEQSVLAMPSLDPAPGTSLREWLLCLGTDTVAVMDADPARSSAYTAFLLSAYGDERLRTRLERFARTMEERFEAALLLLAPQAFDAKSRKALAKLILMTGDGLALHRQMFPAQADSQMAAWRAFVDRIAPEEA